MQWLQIDVTSSTSIARALDAFQPEWVFHLAAQSSVKEAFADPLATWDVNATGTLRLLRALERADAPPRVLVVSSAEVYGIVPEPAQPIVENRPLAPATPYGASKAAAEMAAMQANTGGSVRVVIARSFNHVGPGQESHFALPSFARQLVRIRQGEEDPVLRVGNLEVHRDLLDVRDVVRAYLLLVEQGEPGTVYNVCSGEGRPLRVLVEELVSLSGTGARIQIDPERLRPVDAPLLVGDPTRIRSLGWQPEIPLRETLQDILHAAEAEESG